MRRLSTISAIAAGALAVVIGMYVTHGSPIAKANATQEGFAPNSLIGTADLKTEKWDPF